MSRRHFGVVLHCSACTGKDRRRDVGRVSKDSRPGGDLNIVLPRIYDERGYRDMRPRAGVECPTHGVLEVAEGVVRSAWATFEAENRVQHVPLPPATAC